ncbi:hypothetical protein ACF08M_39945 [Streptomyces sp. NPDC015032]|uniref:hypothetical protein n=1 Tax=Streptomyces sp. NPDC015032 TaxID=3364937 RepID=UPI0037031F07
MVSEHRALFGAAQACDEELLVRLAAEHVYTGCWETLPEDSDIALRPRPGDDGPR